MALPAEASGAHHVQLRAPPLPTSAAEARASSAAGRLLDAWAHLELCTALTGSLAEMAVGAAAAPPPAGPPRMASMAFDPRARSSSPPPPALDYIAPLRVQAPPEDLLSAVVGMPAAVVASAASAVSSTASAVTHAVSSAASTVAGVMTPPGTPTQPAAAAATPATPLPTLAAAAAAGGDGGEAGGAGVSREQRALLEAVAAPKVRGKLPPRKWGKQPSRDETHALLTAAAAAAASGEWELALRGYLRAFEATRATPLLLSAANMHIKLGELEHAQAFCSVRPIPTCRAEILFVASAEIVCGWRRDHICEWRRDRL